MRRITAACNNPALLLYLAVSSYVACLLPGSPVRAGNNDSLSNERIPVSSEELERHWGIDCAGSIRNLLATSDHALDSDSRNSPDTLESSDQPVFFSCAEVPDLGKCALIYNTPGTTFYRACPDYQAAGVLLQQACEHHSFHPADPQSEQIRVSGLLKCD